MGYYTPDWVHIRSQWDFFFLPLAALIGVAVLGVLFFVYPRRFPKDIALRAAFMLAVILITVSALFFSFSQCFWSCHAVDFVHQGRSNADILADMDRLTGVPIPQETSVQVAVMFGWREYTFWYGITTETEMLARAAREAQYQETSPVDAKYDPDHSPELLTNWVRETGFTPTLILRKRDDFGEQKTMTLDPVRGLALVEVIDS